MMPSIFKSWISIVMMAALTVTVAACASATAGLDAVQAGQSQQYRLVAGDKIHITIPDLQSADAEFLIDQTGMVSLPLVKEVKLSGLTLREAEAAIEQALVDKQILVGPTVSVQAVALRPVYILGEVNKPGEYSFREGLTIFSVVSMAGGYTYRADTRSIAIIRNVNGQAIPGKADENTIVMPGDQIRIVEKWF